MSVAEISPVVSVVALIASLFTLWFTILRRGSVRTTHPSFIAFRYDFAGSFGDLAIMIGATFGVRFLAVWLASRADREREVYLA